MRYLLIVALGLVCSIAATAAPLVTPEARVNSTVESLGAAVPQGWQFVVMNEAAWRMNPYTHNSHTAYSLLDQHVTYIRETYVQSAQDDKLRSTIAHEMGHELCGCTDEATANHYQAVILKNNP